MALLNVYPVGFGVNSFLEDFEPGCASEHPAQQGIINLLYIFMIEPAWLVNR
jgi:hypothetical protein